MLIPKDTGIDKIGTYHLSQNPQLYVPQLTNHFVFVVTGLEDLIRQGCTGEEANGRFTNAQEVLTLSADGITPPSYSQQEITVERGNDKFYFPGGFTFDSGSASFNDYVGAETRNILLAWQAQCGDIKTGKVGSLDVTNFKKKCYLIQCTADYREVCRWVYEGVWLQSVKVSDVKSGAGDKSQITVNFRYDRGYIDTSDIQ